MISSLSQLREDLKEGTVGVKVKAESMTFKGQSLLTDNAVALYVSGIKMY